MGRDLTNLYISESFNHLVQISGSDFTTGVGVLITSSLASPLNITVASASYAVSASHEIIKEVSSSYADFAQQAASASYSSTANSLTPGNKTLTGGTFKVGSGTVYTEIDDDVVTVRESNYVTTVDSDPVDGPNVNLQDTALGDSFGLATKNTGQYIVNWSDGPAIFHTNTSGNKVAAIGFQNKANYTDGKVTFLTPISASAGITGNLNGNADTATSASHAVQADSSLSATSSSYASTALSSSHALSADTSISSSYALQADSAISASHALNADNSISSSYAVSASYANNASTADFATLAQDSVYAQNTVTTGKNVSGSPIAKGTPLYFTGSGTSGNLVGVWPADAGNPARMPAGGIAGEAIADGAEGVVLLDGFINGVDTSIFGSGDEVYVAVGGGYTNTPPTGSTNLIQKLGNVEKSAVNGSGVIQMDGEPRGLPNLQQGYLWVGGTGDVPQAIVSSSIVPATASYALNAATASIATVAETLTPGFKQFNQTIGFVATGSNIVLRTTGSGATVSLGNSIYDFYSNANGWTISPAAGSGKDFNLGLIDNFGVNLYNNAFTKDTGFTLNLNTATSQGRNKTGFFANYGAGGYQDLFSWQDATNYTDGAIEFHHPVSASAGIIGNLTGTAVNATNAATASSLSAGDKTLSGVITQNFNAPTTNQEIGFANVTGAAISGKNYDRVFYGIADYPSFGQIYEDYFAIEYYNGFGYNFGSEFNINGKQTNLQTVASGSGQVSYIRTTDNYNGTSIVAIGSPTNILILGPTYMSASSGFPLTADGTINTRRLHFDKNPFNDTVDGSLGAIRLDGTNKKFYSTLYNSNYQIASQSQFVLETDTTSSYTATEMRASYAGEDVRFRLLNNNGTRTAILDTETFYVTGSARFADVMNLAAQDPLPAGVLGDLSVSGSGLYFHNGANWALIS